jgi:sugar phosphate permease
MAQAIGNPAVVHGRRTHFRWFVLAFIFLIYTIAAADRANIGIALPYMQKEFGLSNTEIGSIVSLFGLSYGIFQIPAAFLVRQFGVSAVMPPFMVLTSIFTATLGAVGSPLLLQLNRLALGFAEAPLANSLMTTVNNWFPPREKGQAAGIFISSAKFGPVIVPPIGAAVILHFGWQYIFFFSAIPGIILPLLWYLLVPDSPADSRFCSADEVEHIADRRVIDTAAGGKEVSTKVAEHRSFEALDRLLRTRQVVPIDTVAELLKSWTAWGVTLGYFFVQGIVSVILAWLPIYLTSVKHFEIMKVGLVAAAPFVGAVMGNIVGGWLSDRVFNKRRKPTMIISTIATVFMMYSLRASPNDPVSLAALLFLTGLLFSFGFSAFGIYPSTFTTKKFFPVAAALINAGGQLGTATLPFAVGVILDRANWNSVFLFLSACSLTALILLFTIVEPREPQTGTSNPEPVQQS